MDRSQVVELAKALAWPFVGLVLIACLGRAVARLVGALADRMHSLKRLQVSGTTLSFGLDRKLLVAAEAVEGKAITAKEVLALYARSAAGMFIDWVKGSTGAGVITEGRATFFEDMPDNEKLLWWIRSAGAQHVSDYEVLKLVCEELVKHDFKTEPPPTAGEFRRAVNEYVWYQWTRKPPR